MDEDARYRDFDADDAEDDEPSPTFKFGGETFTCEREVPAAASRRLTKDRLTQVEVIEFIKECLIPEDMDRFDAAVEAKDVRVPARKVTEVFLWLNEVYSGGRPTPPSVSSRNGRRNGRVTSKAASS